MSEEDDWFERALRDLEEDEDEGEPRSESDANGESEADTDEEPADTGEEPAEFGGLAGSPGEIGDDAPAETGEHAGTPTAPEEPEEEGDELGEDSPEVEPAGVGEEDTGRQETGGPEGGFGGGGDPEGGFGGGGGPEGGFGGGGAPGDGGGDEFGFADFDEEGEGFDGEAGGFGGGTGFGGEETFDEEEFESDIERIRVGIEGLDEMILGGIPRRSLITTIGSAGTGKTTFGLQFLDESLRNGEKAVYITLEESREAILSTAEEKGWPFRQYEEDGLLAVVALDPIEMANSLASIRNDLSRLIGDFGAERLVLDSVSLLEMMYDHPAKRRSEVFDFTRSLKEVGVTTMLTSEASEENAYASRHGIVEYLTDAVFILQYVRPSDFRETRLAVEIQKIRDANHSRETKPYEITNEGISVYQQANIF